MRGDARRRERGAGESDESVPLVVLGELQSRHQRSAETNQASMLICVALEVILNIIGQFGPSRKSWTMTIS